MYYTRNKNKEKRNKTQIKPCDKRIFLKSMILILLEANKCQSSGHMFGKDIVCSKQWENAYVHCTAVNFLQLDFACAEKMYI